MFLCVLTSFSWLMWVLHSRVPCVPVSAHSRQQAWFPFSDLGQQEYFVLVPGRCCSQHPRPNPTQTQQWNGADSLFGLLLVHLKGKWNCSQWPVAAETLQFSWIYVHNWTVCPDKTTKQAHYDMPRSERTFPWADVGLTLPRSFSLGDNKNKGNSYHG